MSNVEKGNWDEDFKEDENGSSAKGNSDKPRTLFMDMSKPGKYTIRLIGPHIKCRKHFKPYKAVLQDNEKEIDPAWQAGFFPSRRFAINVIDRADGKLKVLEKGATVFKCFADYKAATGKDPASVKDGPNFVVSVTVPKGNKVDTQYGVTPIGDAPLTKEEMEMINKQKLWPLREIYKSTPADKLKEMWDALPDEKKVAPKRDFKNSDGKTASSETVTQQKSEPVQEKMPDAPADSDDLFGEEKGDDGEESVNMF